MADRTESSIVVAAEPAARPYDHVFPGLQGARHQLRGGLGALTGHGAGRADVGDANAAEEPGEWSEDGVLKVRLEEQRPHVERVQWINLVGVLLLVLTLLLSFTGYLLPWDQLAIWAITVGSNMARATPFLGHEGPGAQLLNLGGYDLITNASDARFILLGGRFVGEATLNRFYILHCVAIPLVVAGLIAIHFWRVRKDGGISQPL